MVTETVEITTTDGQIYRQRVDVPKGQPGNPLTDGELKAKFNSMASGLMSKAQVEQIERMVLDLEHVQDVTELTQLLAVPSRAGARQRD